MIELKKVISDADVKTVCDTAETVWHETYDKLLEPGQVEYMLKKYQSPEALREQIKNHNYEYHIILIDGKAGGFIGFSPGYEAEDEMFLSKIYLKDSFRHMGAFRMALECCVETSRKLGLKKIRLTVNKNNDRAIAVYEHCEFEKVDSVVTDIGGGYVMDDYIMEYVL